MPPLDDTPPRRQEPSRVLPRPLAPKRRAPVEGFTTYWPDSYWNSEKALVYLGDCRKVMDTLPAQSVDLAFADPPFNIQYDYMGEYEDDLTTEQYLNWTADWCSRLIGILKPSASLFVATGIRYQAEIKVLLDGMGLHWRDTICSYYTFGPHQEGKFTPSWIAIHYYTMDPKEYTWNVDTIRVPSLRQIKYNDRRANANGKTPHNVWILDPKTYSEQTGAMSAGHNAWLTSRICGTFKERTGHVCQMNVEILERIVKVASDPGDVILDPFLGSGTTLDAALRLGRRGVGIELSQKFLDTIAIPRLEGIDT